MIKFFFPDLNKRSNKPELMDLPGCDKIKLINSIKQFKSTNLLFTCSRGLIKKYIISDMLKFPKKVHKLLDIGSGGCDIALWLLKQCKAHGINIKIFCLEKNIHIVEYSKKKFRSRRGIKIIHGNAFNLFKLGKFDYIFANHFIHHLSEDEIIKILNLIIKQTNRIFLINDILRTQFAYFSFTLFAGLFKQNSFSFCDGRLSIKKGFRYSEMKDIISLVDKPDIVEIKKCFPSRIYLVGSDVSSEGRSYLQNP